MSDHTKNCLIDLNMLIHVETSKAILASDDGEKEHGVWLPKSQIEIEKQKEGYAIITMPEWLAIEKELI